jgi:hypothetical protein
VRGDVRLGAGRLGIGHSALCSAGDQPEELLQVSGPGSPARGWFGAAVAATVQKSHRNTAGAELSVVVPDTTGGDQGAYP